MKRFIDLGIHAHLSTYNLLIGLGIALSMILLQYDKSFNKKPFKDQYIIHLSLVSSIIVGFICAYVFDAASQNIPLVSLRAGLTLLGGLIPAIFIVIAIVYYNNINVLQTLNLITPYFAITHCLGRVGCFFAGCCFGKPTSTILGVIYPQSSIPFEHYHRQIAIHPTQLYEATFAIVMFLILRYFKPQNAFFIYIASYAIFRFALEYLRADERGKILNQMILSPSQIICLFMFFSILIFWIKQYKQFSIKS